MKLKQDTIGIGQNLKRLRKRLGLSQSQFTRELQLLGISISYDIYKKMEQNRYNIRIYELIAMKQILNVDYDEFFVGLALDDIDT
ncbi:MAG: helix-turn-helix transcriptional regulator [Lachnospiraceae bacterium]|nr:helix-turn-helix transcriptional regulator [Lachnospiraceae bacterium]MCI9179360.1 helix-turn-helix transcriptional regulator [Lachnospiraceae bacterium]